MLVFTIYDINIVVISYQAWRCTVRERATDEPSTGSDRLQSRERARYS